MKWIIVVFIFGNNISDDLTLEGKYKSYDTIQECNQARLDPQLKELLSSYLRLNYIDSVKHRCVQYWPEEIMKSA